VQHVSKSGPMPALVGLRRGTAASLREQVMWARVV